MLAFQIHSPFEFRRYSLIRMEQPSPAKIDLFLPISKNSKMLLVHADLELTKKVYRNQEGHNIVKMENVAQFKFNPIHHFS